MVRFGHQFGYIASDQFRWPMAKQFLDGSIRMQYHSSIVDRYDRIDRGIQNRIQQC
jgi:hypothetical protein